MEAASRGAHEAGGHVVGVTCTLIEDWRSLRANAWVREEKRFATLRERLYHLVEFCDAAVALPGGIGTLSEVALTWSLLQTRELKSKPLVLVGQAWSQTMTTFLREAQDYLHPGDSGLLYLAADVDDAVRFLGYGN
jgi:predicted Rossmann-fold nucleotide-binding protein